MPAEKIPDLVVFFFFFHDTATTEIYTLSLHDALPILNGRFNTSITHAYSIVIGSKHITLNATGGGIQGDVLDRKSGSAGMPRPTSYAVFCLKKKKHRGGAVEKEVVPLERVADDGGEDNPSHVVGIYF